MRNYIQIEDEIFKVTLNEQNAPVVTKVTAEEAIQVQFENIALLDNTVVDTSLLQEIVDKTRTEMAFKIEESIKMLVLSALGFSRNDRDGFVIQGYNDKSSPVVKHIADLLQKKVLEIDLYKEFELTPHEIGKLKLAMTQKFKDTYKEAMSSMVWNAAKELARKHVDEGIRELTGTKFKEVANSLLSEAVIRDNRKTSFTRAVDARMQASEDERNKPKS